MARVKNWESFNFGEYGMVLISIPYLPSMRVLW